MRSVLCLRLKVRLILGPLEPTRGSTVTPCSENQVPPSSRYVCFMRIAIVFTICWCQIYVMPGHRAIKISDINVDTIRRWQVPTKHLVSARTLDIQETTTGDPFEDDWLYASDRLRWKAFGGSSVQGPLSFQGGAILATSPDAVVPLGNYHQVYVRTMITALRGYPIYNPTPGYHYPLQIRRKGFLIGDVGIASETGHFAAFFNLYQPASFGLNVHGVPENFVPLKLRSGNVTKKAFNSSVCLASRSVRVVHAEDSECGQRTEMEFDGGGLEGSVLTLPCGATSEDLEDLSDLEQYAADNIFSWYVFFNKLGMYPFNGDVRVVIGTDKAPAWAHAIYTSCDGKTEDGFRVRFTTDTSNPDGVTSTYSCSGYCFQVVGGPVREFEPDLRDPGDTTTQFCSQTVFVRTLNPMVGLKYWDALKAGHELPREGSSLSVLGGLRTISRRFGLYSKESTWTPASTRPRWRLKRRKSSSDEMTFERPEHPSSALNDKLLQNFPKSKVIITNDRDWLNAVFSEDETLVPDLSPNIVKRILKNSRPVDCNGILLLRSACP